jgi:hypothetical protein
MSSQFNLDAYNYVFRKHVKSINIVTFKLIKVVYEYELKPILSYIYFR